MSSSSGPAARPVLAPARLRPSVAARRLDLLTRAEPTRLELGVFALLVLAVALAVYGVYIARGGLSLDDWAYASEWHRYAGNHDVIGMMRHLLSTSAGLNLHDASAPLMSAGGRPVAAFYLAVAYGIFGTNAALQLAWTLTVTALMCMLVFVLLRTLRVERVHAGAIALLLLVFPASTSTRLWPAAAVSPAAICLFLGGLLLALRAFRSTGRRTIWLHVASLCCYALSLGLYEIAIGAVVLFGARVQIGGPVEEAGPALGGRRAARGPGSALCQVTRNARSGDPQRATPPREDHPE